MRLDRDEFEPAAAPAPPSTLPPALRARLRALGLDLASLAAALALHARQEDARSARRRRRRRERP